MRKSLLINAANLHIGGGVAVATSVLHELSQLPSQAGQIEVLASTELSSNLYALNSPVGAYAEFRVLDTFGLGAARTQLPVDPASYRAVLTLFGPLYWPSQGRASVMGFAQGWVAYPRNEAYRLLSPAERIRTRAKYELVAAAFARADCLVVEQEHVKRALRRRAMFRSKRIDVVPNVVDSLHFEPTRWAPAALPPRRASFRLGLVSHNYAHKNLAMIPEVLQALRSDHGLDAEFWVTFSPREYGATTAAFRKAVRTVGNLSLNQTPDFYRQLDGVVFPSLLESYSATPIETLAARVPLFASDREFVRETVGDHASYFDPLDPSDVARAIADYYQEPASDREARLEAGYMHVAGSRYSSRDRALELLRIANEVAGDE